MEIAGRKPSELKNPSWSIVTGHFGHEDIVAVVFFGGATWKNTFYLGHLGYLVLTADSSDH